MALVKGPFLFKWGTNTLNNISEISVDYAVDTSDTTTLDGRKYTIQTGMSMSVSLTLLDNDVASLATVLPQFWVPAGSQMSTGVVAPTGGAIDVKAASCTTSNIYYNLEVIACGTQADVLRLINARTQIDSIDVADGLRTITVSFIGEPASGQGVVQLVKAS